MVLRLLHQAMALLRGAQHPTLAVTAQSRLISAHLGALECGQPRSSLWQDRSAGCTSMNQASECDEQTAVSAATSHCANVAGNSITLRFHSCYVPVQQPYGWRSFAAIGLSGKPAAAQPTCIAPAISSRGFAAQGLKPEFVGGKLKPYT